MMRCLVRVLLVSLAVGSAAAEHANYETSHAAAAAPRGAAAAQVHAAGAPTVRHFHVAHDQAAAHAAATHASHPDSLDSLQPLVAKEMSFLHSFEKGGAVHKPDAAVDEDHGKVPAAIVSLDKQATEEQQITESTELQQQQYVREPGHRYLSDNQPSLAEDHDHGKISVALLRLAQKAAIERNEEADRHHKALAMEFGKVEPTTVDTSNSEVKGIGTLKNSESQNDADNHQLSQMDHLVNLARKAVRERDEEVTKGERQQAHDDKALISSEEKGIITDSDDDVTKGERQQVHDAKARISSEQQGSTSDRHDATDAATKDRISSSIIDLARHAMAERDEERASRAKQLAAQDHQALVDAQQQQLARQQAAAQAAAQAAKGAGKGAAPAARAALPAPAPLPPPLARARCKQRMRAQAPE
eukprot:CAMPEP_0181307072 /NCGR_PEP_ID=MMETSP1101-20121128/10660_1 /TAXON_ID=46948 /ORGANISM="Rhodomonas abbreviata, Strain Caron Lab Isolate" /LENGTH=416 /DNA_ID=CAMNT_0023413215 /DNA_START=97 /DNA_END=1345 /DNA_ORIENTATION=+